MNFAERFDKYLDENKLFRTEGHRGVKNLEQLAINLGYRENGFRFGDPIGCFLSDNPGAIEAIYDWIRETAAPEWEELFEVAEEEEEFE